MRNPLRIVIRSLILGSVILASGCVVVPVGPGYHCGYYHCR
jgi:hypothetical protein